MPRSHRDLLKRQIARAHYGITRSMGHLASVEAEYHDVHPEDAEALQVAIVGCGEINNLIERFAEEQWGKDIINWAAWIDDPDPRPVDPDLEPYDLRDD
jgi:hypothetical protein